MSSSSKNFTSFEGNVYSLFKVPLVSTVIFCIYENICPVQCNCDKYYLLEKAVARDTVPYL